MYLALYRKYRPRTFDEVIGQDDIIRTLKNQIKNGQISHAYLFCGSRGTGKTSTAKIFARAINCTSPNNGSPCGKCSVCEIENNMDILEIDAASNNGVDEIRDLREKVKYPPVNGKYKVYIIDEVHMLSVNAFNALLKTLEEPPQDVVFILATTEVHKLPATILSRCMRFDFKLVSNQKLVELLEKICKENGIKADLQALNIIARAGEGSVRDTLSVADRCISFCENNLTTEGVLEVLGVASRQSLVEVSQSLLEGDVGKMLSKLDDVLGQGKSPLVFSRDLITYFRDLLYIITLAKRARELIVVSNEVFEQMKAQATKQNYNKILSAIEVLSEIEAELRYSVMPRVVLECNMIKVINKDNLNSRVSELEKKMQNMANFNEKSPKNTEYLANLTVSRNEFNANPAPQETKVEASSSKVDNYVSQKSENEKGEDKSQLLGDLLQVLRKEKAMSLVAAISQVKDVVVMGSAVEFVLEDEITVDMISASKNKKLIEQFFEERGLTFKFVPANKASKTQNVGDLAKLLGKKLQID